MAVKWDFPLLGTGNESGSNIAAITMFKGAGIMDGLAREICQNSLDAKNKELDSNIPVKVKFELYRIRKDDYDMFDGFSEAIKSSQEYWSNSPLATEKTISFLNTIQSSVDQEQIPVLVISDYNTIGLNGVTAGPGETSFWDLLVNTEGVSIKDDNTSAGSYGIGKNAPFAYSAMNLIFYNTFAKDGGRAFEGVARLATTLREYQGEKRKTQPIGKYLYLEDAFTGRPILPKDNCPLSDFEAFRRTDIGTDIGVFGFKESEYPEWETLVATAVLKNFILALYNNKLSVIIKSEQISYEITAETLKSYLFEKFKDVSDLKYTKQIYKTITEPDKQVECKIAEDNDLTIYVKYSEAYTQSLSRFRSTGMLINTTFESLPHFAVVIIANDVGEQLLSTALRESEPPQHTEWKAKNITDNRELNARAGKYIRKITRSVQSVLDDFDDREPSEILDGGVGDFLPDNADNSDKTGGTDGLITDVKIKNISTYDGRILYSSSQTTATGSAGSPMSGYGVKDGEKKRKKKKRKKLKPVTPIEGGKKGITSGTGKVKIVTPEISDHRTFYLTGNKYRLFAQCPKDYEKIYIQYFAARDDLSSDANALTIKSVKINNAALQTVNSSKIGPVKLFLGKNIIHLEFENHEIMAVIPVFTMEVKNEK